jgi:hypothetical protein
MNLNTVILSNFRKTRTEDRIESNRIELFTTKHKNNQKIRKSSGTVRRDKIELVR